MEKKDICDVSLIQMRGMISKSRNATSSLNHFKSARKHVSGLSAAEMFRSVMERQQNCEPSIEEDCHHGARMLSGRLSNVSDLGKGRPCSVCRAQLCHRQTPLIRIARRPVSFSSFSRKISEKRGYPISSVNTSLTLVSGPSKPNHHQATRMCHHPM